MRAPLRRRPEGEAARLGVLGTRAQSRGEFLLWQAPGAPSRRGRRAPVPVTVLLQTVPWHATVCAYVRLIPLSASAGIEYTVTNLG